MFKLRLSLSLPDLVQFNNILLTAAKEASKEKNFELAVQDGQDGSSKQSSDLQNAINQGVDGIVIAPNDVTAMVPALNDLVRANILIVTVDRNVEGTKNPIPHIRVDNTAQGRGVSR